MLKLNVLLDPEGTRAARIFTMSLSSRFHLFDHEATGSLTQMDASH